VDPHEAGGVFSAVVVPRRSRGHAVPLAGGVLAEPAGRTPTSVTTLSATLSDRKQRSAEKFELIYTSTRFAVAKDTTLEIPGLAGASR